MVTLIAVKKLLSLKNVSRRTLIAFLPFLARPDDKMAEQALLGNEYKLYMSMDIRDRDHATMVAKALLKKHPQASSELFRAAFLHDVGKAGAGYKPLERILVHFISRTDIGPNDSLQGFRAAIQRKMYHAEYGAAMIADERVAQIVQKHHRPDGDKEAEILKSIEEVF